MAIDERRNLFDHKFIFGKEEGQLNTLGVTDQIDGSELRFEAVDMDGRRVDKVLFPILSIL